MDRLIIKWFVLAVLIPICALVWFGRVAIDQINHPKAQSWLTEELARHGVSLDLKTNAYNRQPQINITALRYERNGISLEFEQIDIRPQIVRSLLYLRPVADVYIKKAHFRGTTNGIGWQQSFDEITIYDNGLSLEALAHNADITIDSKWQLSLYNAIDAQININQCHQITQIKHLISSFIKFTADTTSSCTIAANFKKGESPYFESNIKLSQLQSGKHEINNIDLIMNGHWLEQAMPIIETARVRFQYRQHNYDIPFALYPGNDSIQFYSPKIHASTTIALLLGSKILLDRHANLVRALNPRGVINHLLFDWRRATKEFAATWHIQAQLNDMSVDPYKGIPGAYKINGNVFMDSRGGFASLDTDNSSLHFAQLYDPKQYPHFTGILHWRIHGNSVHLSGHNLNAISPSNELIQGNFQLLLGIRNNPIIPHLKIQATATQLPVGEAFSYIPKQILKNIPEWLTAPNNNGKVEDLVVNVSVPVRQALLDQMQLKVTSTFNGVDATMPQGFKFYGASGRINHNDQDLIVDIDNVALALKDTYWTTTTAVFRKSKKGAWRIFSDSPLIKGAIIYDEINQIPLRFRFDHLKLPSSSSNEIDFLDTALLSQTLPKISLSADHIEHTTLTLKNLNVVMEFKPQQVILTSIDLNWVDKNITSQDSQLIWTKNDDGTHKTSASGLILFCNYKNIIITSRCNSSKDNYTGQIYADIVWDDHPLRPNLENIAGKLRTYIKNSSVTVAKQPSVLRFIEVLNLTSILWDPPGLGSSIGGSRISFSILQGQASLKDGLITIPKNQFYIISRSGEFEVRGSADIKRKTIDAEIGLVLPVTNNLGWIGWILGVTPVIGIGTEILRQTFKKNLDKLFTVRYSVQGTWDDFKLERIPTNDNFIKTNDKPKLPNPESLRNPPHLSPL